MGEERGGVLLIDEIDKADFEFESLLLEVLSDFQVSIPELGTIHAQSKPLVFLTSNDTRDLSDALKRRCLHLHIPFPSVELEARIVASRVPDLAQSMTEQLVRFVHAIRSLDLKKAPAISETVDWAKSLVLLHARDLDGALVRDTLNVLLKYEEDIQTAEGQLPKLMDGNRLITMPPSPEAQANPSTSSDQLLAFVHYLRGKKIPVSPADTLDAIEVVELTGYADKTLLKNGLAAALAKSQHDLQLFEAAFDDYFQPTSSETPTRKRSMALTAKRRSANDRPAEPTGEATTQPNQDPLEGLRGNALFDALESNDETALSVAIETAAADAKVEEISLFTQRGQYVRKILDALGDEALREAAIEFEQSEPAAFEAVQALREQLRERVRDRVERAYLIHASAATEDLLDESLSKLKLGNIDHSQMARLKRLMDRMARKLAARHGRRRRRYRRGKLHVAETVRRAIPTDGVPFHPRWRKTERKRPQIMAICDVSGSVAAYAKFLLMFLYALQDVLPRTRSFAFSAALGEVSDLFATLPVEEAIERVNLKYGGATDYGRACRTSTDLALAEVNRATTVIILGDARNNQADPRVELLSRDQGSVTTGDLAQPRIDPPVGHWGLRNAADQKTLPLG